MVGRRRRHDHAARMIISCRHGTNNNMLSLAVILLLILVVGTWPSLSSSLVPVRTPVTAGIRESRSSYIAAVRYGSFRTHSQAVTAANSIRGGGWDDAANNAGRHHTDQPLPKELLPITLGVFAQMLGEGISLSSLPLYLTALGSSPIMVGVAISCFSLAQMTFAPIAVGLSTKPTIGRSFVLRTCLMGAACSSLLIAFSGNVYGVIAGRTLAGVFAACVPVAQSSVTDLLPHHQMTVGLSRVSAAAQCGVVVGPLVSATFQEGFKALGIPTKFCLPAVFLLNACNALFVLGLMTYIERRNNNSDNNNNKKNSNTPSSSLDHNNNSLGSESAEIEGDNNNNKEKTSHSRIVTLYAQPMLRTITVIVGWTAILSNSIYGLFAPRFMGFGQSQLSATYSVAAILMVATQLIFPRLVTQMGGEHRACTVGILAVATGIGGQSMVRTQPFHSALYMLNRAGAAIADTSTASMVASFSRDREERSNNLALLTSTRAAARIFTPLLSTKMFEINCSSPFVTAACFCLGVSPFPSVLRRAGKRAMRRKNDYQNKLTE